MATMTEIQNATDGSKTLDITVSEPFRYNEGVELFRDREYPTLKGTTYLDHAGTTPFAKSLIDDFSQNMMLNLLGNPHSISTSSQTSTSRVDDVRLKVLQFFNASPDCFDVVFVANATAGVKLVVEALREHTGGFWYGYHKDAHTSLVGAREVAAAGHHCFESDSAVEAWFRGEDSRIRDDTKSLGLFAYPAQSNMNGRRLPLSWSSHLRASECNRNRKIYTLLDAAALVSTSQLDLSDAASAPDFTVLSFYKIFGFPDLGTLLIRKEAEPALALRKYFGGGTVEMVTCLKEQWHIKKTISLHEQLEDGTLPIHSILALDSAFKVHRKLFKSMRRASSHTSFLARLLYERLASLRHANGSKVCFIYTDLCSSYNESKTQGPVIAFNLRNDIGDWINNSEVEKLASIKNIQLRTGGLCNPGGTATYLGLDPWEMKENFSAGQRCGSGHDIMHGKPTGMIRVSLGAMSTMGDVSLFIAFIEEFFVERRAHVAREPVKRSTINSSSFSVESLTIYPIKSCGGWSVPTSIQWPLLPEGLAWDREWCLVHQGTREALSQKRYPKMALLKPSIDFTSGSLYVRCDINMPSTTSADIEVPLSADPSVFHCDGLTSPSRSSRVCGEETAVKTYASESVASFFTEFLGTPCTLARFPSSSSTPSTRHSKAHLQTHQLAYSNANPNQPFLSLARLPILLSNESPILTISRSSLDALNADIKERNPRAKAADVSVFRANIVLAQSPSDSPAPPYCEDSWRSMRIISQQPKKTGGRETPSLRCLVAAADARWFALTR
ncbi:GPI mannosyltransferase 3 [Physcia stellaris]|nr:GPI mannosyltransferase 3 [Physcia stellaris]